MRRYTDLQDTQRGRGTSAHIGLRLVNGALLLCVIAFGSLAVRNVWGSWRSPKTSDAGPRLTSAEWAEVTKGAKIGAASGRVTIAVFSDFQCPYCARFAEAMSATLRRYPAAVTMVYRYLPLTSIHPFALPAARAAYCADKQGRFEAMHDSLFARQATLGRVAWTDLAISASVPDMQAFERCVEDPQTDLRIKEDSDLARNLGLTGTPTVFINKTRLPGTPTPELMIEAVRVELARGRID